MGRQGPATFSKTLPAVESEFSDRQGTIHAHQSQSIAAAHPFQDDQRGGLPAGMNDPQGNRRACPWRSPSSKFSYGYRHFLAVNLTKPDGPTTYV